MRKFRILLLAALLAISPLIARADSLGSASGGQRAPQSSLSGCTYNSSLPTLTNGQQVGVQCDSSGRVIIGGSISASTSATAASSLPTISAGTGSPLYESLAAALYVQPVFGSASGGGTQVDSSHGLPVNIVAGGGSGGTSIVDEAAFTQGSSALTPIGGTYNSSSANLTTGQAGAVAMTADRSMFSNIEDWGGVALGAMANYGTSPGAVKVPGVNAYVTNTVTTNGGGSAGTANAGVMSVQGIASMTPVQVSQATAASFNATVVNAGTFAVQDSTTETNTGNTATSTASTATNTGTTATNTGTIAGAVTSSVMQINTKQVNGVTTLAGAGATGTGSQRVTVAEDTNTIAGSAPGTAGSASSNVVSVQGIASMTHLLSNIFGNGGVALDGTTAAGTAPTNGLAIIERAENAEPTAATNGQTMAPALDLVGRTIISPWSNKENWIRDYGTSSSTGTTITVLPSGGSGLYSYLTTLNCTNSNATGQYVTLSDSLSTVFYVPGGGGNNQQFSPPLVSSSTATAITVTLSASNAAIYCTGTGFKGT